MSFSAGSGAGAGGELTAAEESLVQTLNALSVTDGNFIVANGSTWIVESGNTARTSLGLGSGDSPTFTGLTTTTGTITTLTVSGDLTVNGTTTTTVNQTVDGSVTIDNTAVESLLVRKNGDSGDVFLVDTSNDQVDLMDDISLRLGTGGDIVLINRSNTLATNTALTGVLVGTPVTPAVAANSLIISNVTSSGDYLLALNAGGNSQAWHFADSAAGTQTLYAAGVARILLNSTGGSFTGTWSDLGSVTTIDINGGTLDGATIGASVAPSIIRGQDDAFRIENPAATFIYTLTGGAILADRILNLPVIAGTDTLAVLGLAQTWTALQSFGTNLGGTLQTAAQTNVTSLGTLTGLTIAGDLTFSAAARDIVMPAATAAALEISDGTTKMFVFDSRVATVNTTTLTLNTPPPIIDSAGTAIHTTLTLASYTLTLNNAVNVTARGTMLLVDRMIITADGVGGNATVDDAAGIIVFAPTESTNVTLTESEAIFVGNATGTPTNQYGLYIENLTAGDNDYGIYIAGADTNALWVDAGTTRLDGNLAIGTDTAVHIKSAQTTAPTTTLTSTTLNDGAGSGATITVTAGSTDIAGSFQITAGNGTPGAGIAGQIVFNAAYTTAPKAVLLTSKDADGTNNNVYISATAVGSFTVSFNTALSTSEVVDFYYWVIE